MKQRNSVLLSVLICCLCAVLFTGCFGPKNPVEYTITVDDNIENGTIECDIATAKAGDVITVTATPDEHYQLVSITVNGEAIEGTSFVMPKKDVVISATFDLHADLVKAIPAGAIKIKAQSAGGASATGHITMTFGANGLTFEALVEDISVVARDGVAILFSRELPVIAGLLPNGQTIKISVSAKGEVSMLATDTDGVLQSAALAGVTTNHGTWSKTGEKLDGYHAEVFVPYEVLGVTADTAKGNISVCPVVYSAYGSLPATAESLIGVTEDAQNTFAVLTDDNTVRDNKYNMLSAQLGSFGTVEQGKYWDLSKDYYADDTANYPNREALLTGHNDNDNNLVFYRVSNNEMYVRATFTVTGVSNKNDQWPKFGLMLFDGSSKKGVFFYVDAVMSKATNNTADDIIGRDLGYNIAPGGDYGAWVTAKGGAFDLASKTIVMEMVYQDGWVHMYADGQLVKSVYYGSYNENLHFGIKSFGIDLKITDYLASDDAEADGWADKKHTAPDAETVDILFAGDSYMEWWIDRGMANCLSYTGAKYANVGVGGTKVQYWMDKASELAVLYVPAKISFHISVNDIDDQGADPNEVLSNLKVMLDKYHEVFPNATIYWNSLVPNTMFAHKYNDYKVVNAGVLEYAGQNEWLVYVDQTTSFDVNGAARVDVFEDGLHFNIDIGYPVWAKNMLTAMGYERPDGTTMGDIDGFAHTGAWEFGTDENGNEYAYSFGNKDTELWFKDITGETVYLEATISVTALRNGDAWPKFGLMVRNDRESRWGFIDAAAFNPANTTAGMAYRGVIQPDGYAKQTSWDWNSVIWGGATGCNFSSVKLAIAKIGDTVYFLVNDTVYTTAPFTGEVSVGYLCYNLETTIRDVVTSTDVNFIEKKLGLACEDAVIDGVADGKDSIWTEEVLANTHKFGDKGDGRYFTVAAAKGSDGVYFLVNTYSFENTRSAVEWYGNANIEFRFGTDYGTQRYVYVDGAGFNAVKTSAGISLAAIKANGNDGNIYHNTFEFYAPFKSFAGYDANSDEIALSVWGWVFDEGWSNVMNVGGYPFLSISEHGLRFERNISVLGENAGVSVDVTKLARRGDKIEATINVAEGQTLEFVKIDGVAYDVVNGKVTFTMPDKDVTIEVALKGISLTTEVVDNSGEGLSANVVCDVATATVGQTITFSVEHTAGAKAIVSVNGEAVETVNGVYSYTVKTTDTAIAIGIALDYDLSEAIDGVKGEVYGTPVTMKVEGGRSFNVWARTDDYGVYLYAEVITDRVVANSANFWDNYNFEFCLNGAEHGAVTAKGEMYRASKGYYNYTQLDNGKYKHIAEVYVNGAKWIPGFDSQSVDLLYAFKTPGETVWHENMINNQWNRADWWRTGHSTPHGGEPIGLGKPNGQSHCIHITKAGLVHDCERASIDGDLSEYAGKNAVIGLGNENAKFDFTGYVADDGVYLGITIYQNKESELRNDWWDNDNFEIKLLGDRAGFTIIEDFLAACAPVSDYAIVRSAGENGYAYKTVIELFYAYDFSSAKIVPLQVGVNGNGFQGWQSLIWDDVVAYITADGITSAWRGAGWENAQRQVAKDMAIGSGLTIDGVADESVYAGLQAIDYSFNGGTVSIIGRKLSTGIVLYSTVKHSKPASHAYQGAGDAWWNFLNFEYRMGGNYTTQLATSTFDNGNFTLYCASKAVTVDNGDGTYTTTFETFLPFSTEYGGMDYDGDVQLCIGMVGTNDGNPFVWLAELGSSRLNATADGLVIR